MAPPTIAACKPLLFAALGRAADQWLDACRDGDQAGPSDILRDSVLGAVAVLVGGNALRVDAAIAEVRAHLCAYFTDEGQPGLLARFQRAARTSTTPLQDCNAAQALTAGLKAMGARAEAEVQQWRNWGASGALGEGVISAAAVLLHMQQGLQAVRAIASRSLPEASQRAAFARDVLEPYVKDTVLAGGKALPP